MFLIKYSTQRSKLIKRLLIIYVLVIELITHFGTDLVCGIFHLFVS